MYSDRCPLSTRLLKKNVLHDCIYKSSIKSLKNDFWCKIDTNCQPIKSISCSAPNVDSLCKQFNEMLSGRYSASLLSIIPNHDKKILNCMLLKRFNDTLDMQNAFIARKYWEEEKDNRIELTKQQQLEYFNSIREKQEMEKLLRFERLNALCKQQELYVDGMRQEQNNKKIRLKKRLAKVQYERNLMQYQRQLMEKRKIDRILNTRCKMRVDEQLKNHECSADLDKRMQRAESIRKKHMNICRRRVIEDNERHEIAHALNAQEIRDIERSNLKYLEDKIADCDRKSKMLRLNKMRWIEESRDRAQITATLRDIVRKSATPDNILYSI